MKFGIPGSSVAVNEIVMCVCGDTGGCVLMLVEELAWDTCVDGDAVLVENLIEEVAETAEVTFELNFCEEPDTAELEAGGLGPLGDSSTIVESVVQLVESDGTSEPCAAVLAAMLAVVRSAGFIALMKAVQTMERNKAQREVCQASEIVSTHTQTVI